MPRLAYNSPEKPAILLFLASPVTHFHRGECHSHKESHESVLVTKSIIGFTAGELKNL